MYHDRYYISVGRLGYYVGSAEFAGADLWSQAETWVKMRRWSAVTNAGDIQSRNFTRILHKSTCTWWAVCRGFLYKFFSCTGFLHRIQRSSMACRKLAWTWPELRDMVDWLYNAVLASVNKVRCYCCMGCVIIKTNAGTFVPKNFRSRERKFHRVELSLPRTKVPWNFIFLIGLTIVNINVRCRSQVL